VGTDIGARAIGTKVEALHKGLRSVLLFSNLYMRRFVLGWKKLGHEEHWKAYIVNYADDLVICCRVGAEQALTEMRAMMSKLKLTVNENKTRVCYLPEEKFDFLGYTFGRCYSMRRGRVYLGTVPSKKRVQRICRAISDETGRDKVWQDSKAVVDRLIVLQTQQMPMRPCCAGLNISQICPGERS
jgi:RNA-directed DNA polymerase